MEFVLTKERQEADRKVIEAQGIADFQRIVTKGISPQPPKVGRIAENTKVVIMGNSKTHFPLFLVITTKP